MIVKEGVAVAAVLKMGAEVPVAAGGSMLKFSEGAIEEIVGRPRAEISGGGGIWPSLAE